MADLLGGSWLPVTRDVRANTGGLNVILYQVPYGIPSRRQEEYQMIANHPGLMSRETLAKRWFMGQPHLVPSNQYVGKVQVCLIHSHSSSPHLHLHHHPPPPTLLRPFSQLVIS